MSVSDPSGDRACLYCPNRGTPANTAPCAGCWGVVGHPHFGRTASEVAGAAQHNSMPDDDALRALSQMADGLLDYFPNALAYVAEVSKRGSDKHNKGQPMHWARGKSTDHRNKILRHLADTGGKCSEGVRHSGNLAWRALALLQEELEREEGYPLSRGSSME